MDDTLGARIRHARLKAGLSQRGLARRAGIAETTLRNWESGANAPRPDMGMRLEDALDADLGFRRDEFTAIPLRSVQASPTPTRGKRQTSTGLDDATVPQLLAELHARDARSAEQLRLARQHIAALEAENARLLNHSRITTGEVPADILDQPGTIVGPRTDPDDQSESGTR